MKDKWHNHKSIIQLIKQKLCKHPYRLISKAFSEEIEANHQKKEKLKLSGFLHCTIITHRVAAYIHHWQDITYIQGTKPVQHFNIESLIQVWIEH